MACRSLTVSAMRACIKMVLLVRLAMTMDTPIELLRSHQTVVHRAREEATVVAGQQLGTDDSFR